MARPVHGDARIDHMVELLAVQMLGVCNEHTMRNCSLPVLKQLSRNAKIAVAYADDAALTKVQQTIGGHKGGTRRKTKPRR